MLYFGILVALSSVVIAAHKHHTPCKFPAIYNFGDSNSDTGAMSAAFYPSGKPSGETFFHSPAGRGSDGRLIIDYIADHLGLPLLNPYLDTLSRSYMHGANFAAGGATIRPQNISFSAGGSSPFSLDIQTLQFTQFKHRATDLFKTTKKRSVKRRLPRPRDFAKALYMYDIGQNDIARGMENMSRDQLMADIPDMINKLAASVQAVYDQGGRTFWIHNTGPIGCLPVTLHYYHHPESGVLDQNGCLTSQNEYALEFNKQLKKKVATLRRSLGDASLVYVDIYRAKFYLIGTAREHGFVDARKICCGYHEDDDHVYCGNKGVFKGREVYAGSCKDPASHISWDGVHYTDAANGWVATKLTQGLFSQPLTILKQACEP